jgi:hypothetical protein
METHTEFMMLNDPWTEDPRAWQAGSSLGLAVPRVLAQWSLSSPISAVWQAGCIPGSRAAAMQWCVGRHPYLSPGFSQQNCLPRVPPAVSPLGWDWEGGGREA